MEVAVQQVAATGVALFADVATMYEEGYLGRPDQIATPTREKETFYLNQYIVPAVGRIAAQPDPAPGCRGLAAHDIRFLVDHAWRAGDHDPGLPYAEGHGLWEEGKRSPVSKAKLGKKHHKYERRILSFEETARVLGTIWKNPTD